MAVLIVRSVTFRGLVAARVRWLVPLGAALAAVALAADSAANLDGASKAAAPTTKFVSKMYGYEVVLAGEWKPKYARKGWDGEFPLMDGSDVDVFRQTPDRFFLVAATRLPPGTTLREWVRSHVEVMAGFALCRKTRPARNTKLGGMLAREFLIGCLVHDAIVVAAVHRGRGYTFQFVSLKENSEASDRATFGPARRSVRFTR